MFGLKNAELFSELHFNLSLKLAAAAAANNFVAVEQSLKIKHTSGSIPG
jgi:hypothetical protein